MLLVCPECDAKYQIADSAIPEKGRNVRCAACGHYWYQKRDGISKDSLSFSSKATETAKPIAKEATKAKALPKLPHEKMREKSQNKIIITQILGMAAGYLVSFGIAGAAIYGFIANKESIVQKWPKSASLYRFLGSPVNLYGLEIKNVQVRAGVDSQGSRLVVAGVVRSIAHEPKTVPYLRVNLTDKKGKIVLTWLIDPKVTILEGQKSIAFESIRRDPPSGDLKASVFFADPPIKPMNIAINNHAAPNKNAPNVHEASQAAEIHNAPMAVASDATHEAVPNAAGSHDVVAQNTTGHEANAHDANGHTMVGR